MTNKTTIIANWKMQLSVEESNTLAESIVKKTKDLNLENIDIILCPDFMSIGTVSSIIKESDIYLGSQNVSWQEKGAFTGEISIDNLKYFNVKYSIIGHSERRKLLNEGDEMINQKMKSCIKNNIVPILCVGESFEERRNDQKDFVIINQVRNAFKGIEFRDVKKIFIAYEPVWVIGSGQAIEPIEAEHTNLIIKEAVLEAFLSEGKNVRRDEINEKLHLIYGGSVDDSNVADFMNQENIYGVLVGGASLKIDSFMSLLNIVNNL